MRSREFLSEASIFTRTDKYSFGHKVRVGTTSAKGKALLGAIQTTVPDFDPTEDLEWVEKAIVLRPEAYWMLRTKSLIQAELGLYAEAIKTAEQCIKLAEADGDTSYVNQSKNSITAWKKLK